MDRITIDAILALIKREVVPAMGCTEPAAVSLAVAKATELLGTIPEHIDLQLSGNIIKNAMGVGIPGTGMIGLPIAVALGALVGKSEYGLEVLKDVNDDWVEEGKKYIAKDRISICHKEDAPSNLYIEVEVRSAEGGKAKAIISGSHQNFVHLSRAEEVLLDTEAGESAGENNRDVKLTAAMVYDFAMTAPREDILFIMEAKRLNSAAADLGMSGKYGHSLGMTLLNSGGLIGVAPLDRMMARTSAACDARMGGAQIAVMSNSGSGNQGITATMPVVTYAEEISADEETTARALILSHLTSIYIKQSLGTLSALCGCVVASTGASAGLVYLMGGNYDQVCAAIKNMVANLTGMICDGAKPACSMKISSGVATAVMSAMLAMNCKCVTASEGIISDDIDVTINNLTSIGREAMRETDKHVLKIMVEGK
ncbi:MAG: L-serine ammonia-lyase, iron-sulfur-dependent, subunit alpha [Muribaculaceae bacterium]|nr:L-serine ammonia-lyase, iron-sulfur-dependent, subunit alpha [Muribaculaceae bacterium]